MKFHSGHWEMQRVELINEDVRVYSDIYGSYDLLQASCISTAGPIISARWLPNMKVEVVYKIYGGKKIAWFTGPDEIPEWGPTIWDNR